MLNFSDMGVFIGGRADIDWVVVVSVNVVLAGTPLVTAQLAGAQRMKELMLLP